MVESTEITKDGHDKKEETPTVGVQEAKEQAELSHDEYERYTRQLIMRDVGLPGQLKLKNARVLLIGAGGLGSPAALYLAGAGVGTLGLVDADTVDESNLHRQVIHTEDKKGEPKVLSAQHAIGKFNRHVTVLTYQERFNTSNAMRLLTEGEWHIVMDGSDNAPTRYLISDACVEAKLPLVSGSALQWEGQATVYNYKGGPCYRCLFPLAPPAHTVTNCSDGGVLGMVPGLIGQIQAIEIVKMILEVDTSLILTQRMVFFDALSMKFRNVKIRGRNPKCASCGDNPTIKDVSTFDYDDFCQTNCNLQSNIYLPEANTMSIQTFGEQIKGDKESFAIVDVRPQVHYGITNLPGSVNIPLKKIERNEDDVRAQLTDLSKSKSKVFIMCRRGGDSREATKILMEQCSLANVVNVEGGINGYSQKVDDSVPFY